jgi:hypothetical protein
MKVIFRYPNQDVVYSDVKNIEIFRDGKYESNDGTAMMIYARMKSKSGKYKYIYFKFDSVSIELEDKE